MSGHNANTEMYDAPLCPKDPGSGQTMHSDRFYAVWLIETAAAETRTLAAPLKAGLLAKVVLDTDGGNLTLTVEDGYNLSDDTTITFQDAGDWVLFGSVREGTSYYWRVLSSEGVAMTVATEHGAGAIGTAAAPVTSRHVDSNGDIVTEIRVDLTGLNSKDTANDVIGLSAGGAAYIGQYVVATCGVVYKMELICLETPAGGDDDVNVVANVSAVLAYDGAGGTTYGVDGGDAVAGQVVQDLVQGLTDTHYLYLTAGTGDTAAAYTAGMFIVRMYGHPVLA